MKLASFFLAKHAEEEKWLPLSVHLEDTAEVCAYLCRQYVSDAMISASSLNREEFERLSIFLSAVHDIGKATASFQGKICAADSYHKEKLKERGFSVAMGERVRYSPHALAGAAILNQCFAINESVCEVVAAHHGRPRQRGKETKFKYQLSHYTDNYYSKAEEKNYRSVWEEIYLFACERSGISHFPEITATTQMILTGFVIMSDWIASNEEFFPLFSAHTAEDASLRAADALKKLRLPSAWEPSYAVVEETVFEERFGFALNAMQKAVLDTLADVQYPGIVIIEAPMGLGKTEAEELPQMVLR